MIEARTRWPLSVDLFKADDTVSADPRFPGFDCATTRPSSNGAWLCKNSWGTNFGEDGYFWISYEDACLNRPDSRVYVYDMAKADNYDNNYQYDGSPAPFYNTLPSGGSIANVFTAKANAQGGEELKAVSLAIYDVNVDYSIQISARLAGRGCRLARRERRLNVRSATSFAPLQKTIARFS